MHHPTKVYFIPFPWTTCWGHCIEESGVTTNNGSKLSSSNKAQERTSDEKNMKNDDQKKAQKQKNSLPFIGSEVNIMPPWLLESKNSKTGENNDIETDTIKSSQQILKENNDKIDAEVEIMMVHELEFDKLDQNGDGFISLKEWTGTNKNFANFDITEDHLIEEDEFFVAQNIIQALSVEFRKIVGSKNQMMSFNDALTFLEQIRNLTHEENLQTFEDADIDKTKTLSQFEFSHLNLH